MLEEMGKAAHPGPFLSSAVAAVRALCRLAPDAESALLAKLAGGSAVATVALLEPGAAYRWEKAATVADGGRLTGEKSPVPDAMAAEVFLVLASDGVLYAVDRSEPGVEVAPRPSIDGTRKHGALRLAGAPGRAIAPMTQAVVDDLLVARGFDALGAAQRCLDLAVEYAKVREQFGRPIGSFQAVQHLCADMLQAVELARSTILYAQWAADNAAAGDFHLAAVMAKAHGGALVQVAETAIQVFGGIGYTWEHDVHLFYKRLLSFDAYLGTSTHYLRELGAEHIGQRFDAVGARSFVGALHQRARRSRRRCAHHGDADLAA